MSSPAVNNFMKQQGFPEEPADACNMHFSALYFQPRIVFPLLLLGVVFQWAPMFLALGAVIGWNAVVPRLNPIELFYNRFIARPRGGPFLTPAPAPRRFAQGMMASLLLAAGVTLLAGWTVASWSFQAFLVVGFSALLFAKFCLAAYLYHLGRGEVDFANSTLPWARSHR